MKVVVTGGAGYIGCSLTEQLVADESVTEVVVYDNLSAGKYNLFSNPKIKHPKVRFIIADILDNKSLSKALDDSAVVFHLAAKVSEPDSASDSQAFEQVNHWGTAQLVAEIEKRPSIRKVIYASSVYVYGHLKQQINETTATLPNSFYGNTKLKGEEQLQRLKGKADLFVFRLANVFGVNRCTRYNVIINKLMFEAHYQHKVRIIGSGDQVRPFVSVDNAATALMSPLKNDQLKNGIYNVAEFNSSVNDVVDHIMQLYPGMEYQYLNKHLSMGSIEIETPGLLSEWCDLTKGNMSNYLETIRNHFV